jgi:thiol:disulfide interchange protein DsbA
MKRREFSAAAAGVLGASAGPPGLALAQRSRGRQGLPRWKSSCPGGRARRQGRGGRVLLVQLPALQRLRAQAGERGSRSCRRTSCSSRVPVAFRDDFVPQQRLYYTLEAMGKLDELHDKVFQAIHVNREPDRQGRHAILAFAEKQRPRQGQVPGAVQLVLGGHQGPQGHPAAGPYEVDGVPALGIAGRYYTDGTLAGNMDRALQVSIT